MTTEIFNDAVEIQGSQDIVQLQVEGPDSQTANLQEWRIAGVTAPVARLTSDGRLQVGVSEMGTPDALIEANNEVDVATSPAKPRQGIQSRGRITGAIVDGLAWMVGELELLGSGGITGIHTALRSKLLHNKAGDATNAELRAGDFEVVNQSGTALLPVGQVTGLQSTISNQEDAHIDEAVGVEISMNSAGHIQKAYGLRVEPINQATSENYAIHTGQGAVHLGDFLELAHVSAPSVAPSNTLRLYAKADNKIYSKDAAGVETQLGAGGGNVPIAGLCHGRLTLSSGTPIPLTDVLAATTLYFTPFQGNQVALFDGAQWALFPFTERSLSLTGLEPNTVYDIFLYDNAGALTLEAVGWNAPDNGVVTSISNASPRVATVSSHTLNTGQLVTIAGNSVASNNATWRVGTKTATTFQLLNLNGTNSSVPGSVGTGGTWRRADQNTSRVTELVMQDGVYVKSGALARRYLGTIRTTNIAGQCQDSAIKRFVFNQYNPVARDLKVIESVDWTYATSAWRAARNNLANRVEVVIGATGCLADLDLLVRLISSGAGAVTGISYDAVNTYDSDQFFNISDDGHSSAHLKHYPSPGYHYYQWVENARGNSTSFYGYAVNAYSSGITGVISL